MEATQACHRERPIGSGAQAPNRFEISRVSHDNIFFKKIIIKKSKNLTYRLKNQEERSKD